MAERRIENAEPPIFERHLQMRGGRRRLLECREALTKRGSRASAASGVVVFGRGLAVSASFRSCAT